MPQASDHRKLMTQCYQKALSRLRVNHDEEFHTILVQVYEEEGVDVRKRESRQAASQRRLNEARALLEAAGVNVP